jgi:nicotinate phosphoribosyltransferase
MGGFDGTSNVKAASVFGMGMKGTHAHSFVVSFYSLSDLKDRSLVDTSGVRRDFAAVAFQYRNELKRLHTHEGELTAFISYAQAFPDSFLGLLDTFDTLESGVWNFVCVALALHQFGYRAVGIRLDSGDLAYLSRECRKIFVRIAEQYGESHAYFAKLNIVASNDLSEKVLYALKEQGHEIDTFGVGTNLVTCKNHPALGCVYKLVEVNGQARMTVSSQPLKVSIPCAKEAFRLFNSAGEPVLDLLVQSGTVVPVAGRRILCRHPFDANKRVYVTPAAVEPLHQCVWDGALHSPAALAAGKGKHVLSDYPSLDGVRALVTHELSRFREDHLRRLNPTPYKVAVSSDLFAFMADLWLQETGPIPDLGAPAAEHQPAQALSAAAAGPAAQH